MSNLLSENQPEPACQIYPYGVSENLHSKKRSIVTLYNNQIIDLEALEKLGVITTSLNTHVFNRSTLNFFASQGKEFENEIQTQLRQIFSNTNFESLPANLKSELILSPANVKLLCPFEISDYADFFACRNHAENASKILLGDNASLNLNWEAMPIGYYGRSGSVTCGNHPINTPSGNIFNPLTGKVEFLKSNMVDFEVELGFFIGKSSYQEVVSTQNAADYIFGVVILNDWSARDIQSFESQPLGPFLSKSFATTISPWVFSYQALQPFMSPIESSPLAMKHLKEFESGVPEIEFTVTLNTPQSTKPIILSKVTSTNLSWSLEQITTHITSNGSSLNTGDLIGTGTISGSSKQELGCLLEITKNGKSPIHLPNKEQRIYLQRGDNLTISACCYAEGISLNIGRISNKIK